jgi:hypothetical protein
MANVHYDSPVPDDDRRRLLYSGDLFVYSPVQACADLVALGRGLVEQAFAPHDPELAQFEMPVTEFARLLGELKPRFIHHPECKRLLPKILGSVGCDPEKTYFDVPRLRTSASGDYLKTGIAYAFHPHRDTWYSAPMCQLNWWIPLYPIAADNGMAFHPRYWANGLRNSSSIYNYQEWNQRNRFNAAEYIGEDPRPQPKALEPVELSPDIRLLPPPGGIIIFSGAQMHSSVPNTSGRTRFSIDFRTVQVDDVIGQRGAPNVDSQCTGSTMGDYLRCTDLAHLPDDATKPYDRGPPPALMQSPG